MSIEDITNQIQKEGEKKAREILAAAQTEAENVKQTATQKAESLKQSAQAKTDSEAKEMMKQGLAQARQKSRQSITTKKRVLLDQTVNKARNVFEQLPDPQYLSWLEKSKEIIPNDFNGRIYLGAKNYDRAKILINEHFPQATTDRHPTIKTGLVAVSENTAYELTFDRLLKLNQGEIEMRLQQILFKS